MSVTTTPSGTLEVTLSGAPTGLTGTIGVRVTDGQGATTIARTTSGIVEYPSGSGIYTATLTAPAVAGQYVVVWDTGTVTPTTTATEDLTVTYTATPTSAATGSLVNDIRRLISAGTAEYSAGGTVWWSDAQLQDVLENHRAYVTGVPLQWAPEPVVGGAGTLGYYRARVDLPGVIEPASTAAGTAAYWKCMTPGGNVPSGTVTFAADGWATFSSDQRALQSLEYYGWIYDLFAAAAECLDTWASHVKTAYDFKTDDQAFNRSQVAAQLAARAEEMRRQKAPNLSQITVTDDVPGNWSGGGHSALWWRTHGDGH